MIIFHRLNSAVEDKKKEEEKNQNEDNGEKLNNVMKVSKIQIHDTEIKEDIKNLSIVSEFMFSFIFFR